MAASGNPGAVHPGLRVPGRGLLGFPGIVWPRYRRRAGDRRAPFPVGALVTPHTHTRDDEYSIVTEGQIGFRSGDREVVLGVSVRRASW